MDELYCLAGELWDAALWDALPEDELFAVRSADGETVFCFLLGWEKVHYALMVCPDIPSLTSLLGIGNSSSIEGAFETDCMICSFEVPEDISPLDPNPPEKPAGRLYPVFRRCRPLRLPWFLAEVEDYARMALALRGAIALSALLPKAGETVFEQESCLRARRAMGFCSMSASEGTLPVLVNGDGDFSVVTEPMPELQLPSYPTPRLEDELRTVRLGVQPPRLEHLYCELVLLPVPTEDDPPRLPVTLLWTDGNGRFGSADVENYEEDCDVLLRALWTDMETHGRPKVLLVRQARTYALLQEACRQSGIPLEQSSDMDFMDVAGSQLMEAYMRDMTFSEELLASAAHRNEAESGRCLCCGRSYTRRGMYRHLKACPQRALPGGPYAYYLLRAEGTDASSCFLYLDVSTDTTLETLAEALWTVGPGNDSRLIHPEMRTSAAGDAMLLTQRLGAAVKPGDTFLCRYGDSKPVSLLLTVLELRRTEQQGAQGDRAA